MSASNRFRWKHCLALAAALLLPVWASSALGGPAASLTGSGVEVPAPQPSSLTVPAGEELGRRNLGHIVRTVPARKGLAVIADFADARLEDWRGPGIRSVAQLRAQLQHMEAHWAWLSRGHETFHWDIIRITLPVGLRGNAYAGWGDYRDAVASLARAVVDPDDYDSNHDGVIDTLWAIASSNGCTDCTYIIGGASQNGGANIFVDGQDSGSLVAGATGNFNHETGHTLGLPDLYGPYGTISYLSIMADSWANPPNDFTAFERILLGWLEPLVVDRTRWGIHLSAGSAGRRAIRVPTGHPAEYFLIEYRRRPASGYGSTATVPYDGLAIYHVLEGSNQWSDPPLLKLEPADGRNASATGPERTDFFYPRNSRLQQPIVLRSYFGNQEVFRLNNLRRVRSGALVFDIKLAPIGSPANMLANPSFENAAGGSPVGWRAVAYQPTALFGLDAKVARTGQRSASISAPVVNDARWEQSLSNLNPGQSYALCGWVRGEDVATTSQAPVGANISIIGGFVRSNARSGTFDWAESCVIFKPETTPVVVGCRIGFFGSTVTGRIWCDDLSLAPLRSAF